MLNVRLGWSVAVESARRARSAFPAVVAVLLSLLGISGCKPTDKAEVRVAPPPEVATEVVKPHDVDLTYVYAGRVTAYRQVEVRARVGGVLEERSHVEGAHVDAGELLFRIQRAPYEAAVARAAAQLRQEIALREKAERDVKRANALLATQAGTALARDDSMSALSMADAAVAIAEAELRTQALNLGYTRVIAPLSGVTSLEAAPEGSLVGTTPENSLLTRITQTDPIYVTFSFDNDDLSQVRALAGWNARLRALLSVDGKVRTGQVDFTDSSIDQGTGTVRGRALFDNADQSLVPGQFVRITLCGVVMHGALSVPKIAVGQDETGTFVYLVDGGRARRAPIALGPSAGEKWVVDGLRGGDALITEGFVHVREGGPVRVVGKAAE